MDRLDDDDLATLGYGPWSAALQAGIAPHHAGLVPAFRQAVEQCFSEGLAESGLLPLQRPLALGINMHRPGRWWWETGSPNPGVRTPRP